MSYHAGISMCMLKSCMNIGCGDVFNQKFYHCTLPKWCPRQPFSRTEILPRQWQPTWFSFWCEMIVGTCHYISHIAILPGICNFALPMTFSAAFVVLNCTQFSKHHTAERFYSPISLACSWYTLWGCLPLKCMTCSSTQNFSSIGNFVMLSSSVFHK